MKKETNPSVPEIEFHKMHGAGNDFVLLDARHQEVHWNSTLAKHLAHRRLGVGCDQLLLLRQARDSHHRASYEIFNADGSAAGQCGNGARCIALYLDLQDGPQEHFTLESPAGVIQVRRCEQGYELEMGVPSFRPEDIPLSVPQEQSEYEIASPWGSLTFGAASMGNPHALVLVNDLQDADIPQMGEFLRTHKIFLDSVNAGFATIESREKIRLRVIERGVGETLACGSGACAAVALLRRRGLVGERVSVELPGGQLVIKWREEGVPLTMAGPAKHVFKGIVNE